MHTHMQHLPQGARSLVMHTLGLCIILTSAHTMQSSCLTQARHSYEVMHLSKPA